MNKIHVDNIINSFFFTEEELKEKEELKSFIFSIAHIIVDELMNKYLLKNPYLSIYLAKADINRFTRNLQDFIVFILSSPIDEKYLKRVYYVGFVHYAVKLDPAKVHYGFWAIGEILKKVCEINQVAKKYEPLITKIFKMVEFLMIEGYLQEKEKENQISQKINWLSIQNELFLGFSTIKEHTKLILQATRQKSIEPIKDIPEDVNQCKFKKTLLAILDAENDAFSVGIDVKKVDELHEAWHIAFSYFKQSIKDKHYEESAELRNEIASISKEIRDIFDLGFKKSIFSGQVAITSGIKALRAMAELFYKKDFSKKSKETKIDENFKNSIKEIILEEFGWAVREIKISLERIKNKKYQILKIIRFEHKDIYIGVELKKTKNEYYIHEILVLLLEMLDLHFSMKERESSLIEFADKAESANKAKDMFLASMSHELRTPLNAIIGFSQILMIKQNVPPDVKQFIEKINIAGNNLLELVNTILDFAKLEAGKMQFSPSICLISSILKEIDAVISPLANEKNIDLHIPKIVSLMLYIDCKLFKQVLLNLLSNAIKFTQKNGKVSLEIDYLQDKKMYEFKVIDNGIGISEESIKKLFKPFSQVENVYQKKHKGTGLGLMISKKIIEDLHKGKIVVESKLNEGSTFSILLPTSSDVLTTSQITNAPKNAKKILIVEDSKSYQKVLTNHLEKNYHLTITNSVNRAKHLLENNHFDFIILDFFLLDGISSEILQFMKDENMQTPAIVISAEDDVKISSSLINFSNLDGILKKENIDEICAVINRGSQR